MSPLRASLAMPLLCCILPSVASAQVAGTTVPGQAPPPPPVEAAPAPPPPPEPEARRQIGPGHVGVTLGVPGLVADPVLPPIDGVETLPPLRGPLGLRLRASDQLVLRAHTGFAAARAGADVRPASIFQIGAGAEWHPEANAWLSPYAGAYVEALLLNTSGAPLTAVGLGAMVGVEVFPIPRASVSLEYRLGVATLPGSATWTASSGAAGLGVNLYF